VKVVLTGSSERGLTAYIDALRACAPELELLLLLPGASAEEARELCRGAGGLVVTGGIDIHPAEYGEEPAGTEMANVQPERDALERITLEEADERGLPILAICRGMQMLNVHRGGALLQDIGQGHRDGRAQEDKWRPFHEVEIDGVTRLAEALGGTTAEVNSRHHQAVDPGRVGMGLRVVGWCPADGVVEALEGEGARFVVAVQWHPENMAITPEAMPEREQARALFAAFAAAVRERPSVRS
jgi:putative glutamine amidotransferase